MIRDQYGWQSGRIAPPKPAPAPKAAPKAKARKKARKRKT